MSNPEEKLPQAKHAELEDPTDVSGIDPEFSGSDVFAGLVAAYGPGQPPESPASRARSLCEPGSIIADKYRLIEPIGEGGMGSVWYAEQLAPLKRKVAIKLIKPGLDSHSVLTRFEAERQALALMDHPNIAKVFDGGVTELGHPFFVMELVRGTSITTWCDQNKIGLRERLELLIPVCQAIHHAHQKGIIHRDIKPSNVMVAMFDGKPVPKVIDFGVAKAFGTTLLEESLHTAYGAVVGTAEYMSPEQAQLNNLDIDTRSDVYSLGVLMYELLAGSTPFPRAELAEQGWQEVLRVIRDVDPPLPSVRLSTSRMRASIAALRSIEPGELGKLLRSELDWIVMKSLEKDRLRRYESASALAGDLGRYLRDEPVEACPPSTVYRLRKFARRYHWQVLAGGLLLATLLAGIIGTSLGLIRAESQRKIAVQALKAADERAEGERQAKLEAQRQQKLAEAAEEATLESYRVSTDDAMEKLIISKATLTILERNYLENALKRWQVFADRKGDDPRSRSISAEGHFRVGVIWQSLGDLRRAAEEFELASETMDWLMQELPREGRYRYHAVRYRRNLAMMLYLEGRYAEAVTQLRHSFETGEELVVEFSEEAHYRQELIQNLEWLGILLGKTGNLQESESTLRQAVRMQEELVNQHPNVAKFRLCLATCYLHLAKISSKVGGDAELNYRLSLSQFERLVVEDPTVLNHRLGLAGCLTDLGNLVARRGDLKDAEKMLRRAVEVNQALAAEFPAAPQLRGSLAQSHQILGWFTGDFLSNTVAAEAEYREALKIRQRLASDFPANQAYRSNVAKSHFTLGNILSVQANPEAAREEFLTSLHMFEELGKGASGPSQASDQGWCLCNLGQLELDFGNYRDSLQWFTRAIDTVAPVHKLHPELVDLRELLKNSHRGRAKVKRNLNQDDQADWDEALKFMPDDGRPSSRLKRVQLLVDARRAQAALPELEALVVLGNDSNGKPVWNQVDWYNFACCFSTISSLIPDRKKEFEDRSMELLTKAVNAGFMDLPFIIRDKELDPIRERPEFAELLEKLKSGTKGN